MLAALCLQRSAAAPACIDRSRTAAFKNFVIFTWNFCAQDSISLSVCAFQMYDQRAAGFLGAWLSQCTRSNACMAAQCVAHAHSLRFHYNVCAHACSYVQTSMM
ncbi:hypothetical protein EON66_08595 [archaeon]|nr:MAG: hypothetical protein EON66_08595 [archaeon]